MVNKIAPGQSVLLCEELDAVVPAGRHIVSAVNKDGSFHCDGGRTAVWPRRIVKENEE